MSGLMRSLLIWLLVLALPAQGAAVAAMVGCGPRQHAAAVVAGLSAAGLHAHAHAHSHADATGPAAHRHHHHAVPATGADAADASANTSPAPDGAAAVAADVHKCSACASCCSAGAILNTVPSVPMPEFATLVFADWVVSVGPFAVDGPDRPPRSILA